MVKSSKKQKSGHDAQLKAKKGLKVDKVVCKNKVRLITACEWQPAGRWTHGHLVQLCDSIGCI